MHENSTLATEPLFDPKERLFQVAVELCEQPLSADLDDLWIDSNGALNGIVTIESDGRYRTVPLWRGELLENIAGICPSGARFVGDRSRLDLYLRDQHGRGHAISDGRAIHQLVDENGESLNVVQCVDFWRTPHGDLIGMYEVEAEREGLGRYQANLTIPAHQDRACTTIDGRRVRNCQALAFSDGFWHGMFNLSGPTMNPIPVFESRPITEVDGKPVETTFDFGYDYKSKQWNGALLLEDGYCLKLQDGRAIDSLDGVKIFQCRNSSDPRLTFRDGRVSGFLGTKNRGSAELVVTPVVDNRLVRSLPIANSGGERLRLIEAVSGRSYLRGGKLWGICKVNLAGKIETLPVLRGEIFTHDSSGREICGPVVRIEREAGTNECRVLALRPSVAGARRNSYESYFITLPHLDMRSSPSGQSNLEVSASVGVTPEIMTDSDPHMGSEFGSKISRALGLFGTNFNSVIGAIGRDLAGIKNALRAGLTGLSEKIEREDVPLATGVVVGLLLALGMASFKEEREPSTLGPLQSPTPLELIERGASVFGFSSDVTSSNEIRPQSNSSSPAFELYRIYAEINAGKDIDPSRVKAAIKSFGMWVRENLESEPAETIIDNLKKFGKLFVIK